MGFAFRYLDRYYVPSLKLTNLHGVKLEIVGDSLVDEAAASMWHSVADAMQRGCVRMSSTCLQELCAVWFSVSHAVGIKANPVEVLRGHLALSLSNHGVVGYQRSCGVSAVAANNFARRTQLPCMLVPMIVDYLSGDDLCHLYRVKASNL